MDLTTNTNTRWMAVFVEELALNGLEAVCVAPGSRSTPLTLAFANHPAVKLYRHLDERSAGFFALGLALASGKPAALLCTSGTAAANFHPAIVEAYYSHVPLLVLTADRPAELRGSGANQTIDQIKMFGDHVLWSVEVPTPQANGPEVVLRHLRTLASRAYAMAGGLVRGPVHLNFPFRKPLEPDAFPNGDAANATHGASSRSVPYTSISRGRMIPDTGQIAAVAAAVAQNPRGVIICGPDCPAGEFPARVAALARQTGYPVLADPLSNVRHGDHVNEMILGGYHLWLPAIDPDASKPTLVLRFGAVATSSALPPFLERAAPDAHFHVREDGQWADDLHLTHDTIQADPAAFCAALSEQLTHGDRQPDPAWAALFVAAEAGTWRGLELAMAQSPFFDGSAVKRVLATLPEDTILFAGNSMPVRHVDTFDQPSRMRITIAANRGASGIDGNVSTALGLAAASGKRVVALLGDITFYHDMNGLLAIRQNAIPNVTFVVLNNDGGSIFHRLPVAKLEPPFTDLFLMPHGLTFEHAAAMYGLGYAVAGDESEMSRCLAGALADGAGPQLVEVKTNSTADFQHMKAVAAHMAAMLRTAPDPAL